MSMTPRAGIAPFEQFEPQRPPRFIRVCRDHGRTLLQDQRGRLRCPCGHAITPFRGGWSVVDLRSGRVVAAATTESIEVADGFLHDALTLFRQARDTTSPARNRRLPA